MGVILPEQLTTTQADFLKKFLGVDLTVTQAATIPPGLVKKRAFLIARWQKIPGDLKAEIDTLRAAVAVALPHEDAAGFGGAVSGALNILVEEFRTTISSAVDAAINADDPQYREVARAIADVKSELATSALMQALRSNSLAAGQGFEATFIAALDEIETQIVG